MAFSVIDKFGHLRDVDLDDDPVEEPDDGLVLKDGVVRRGSAPGGGGGGEASGAHAETVGDGTEVTFDIAHGLGTRNIGGLAAWDVTTDPEERLAPAWLIVDQNTVRVTFPSAPATDGARVVVLVAGGETGGGGGVVSGWVPLGSETLEASASNIALAVPEGYAFLRLTLFTTMAGSGRPAIRCNGDSGSNYFIARYGTSTTFTSQPWIITLSTAPSAGEVIGLTAWISKPYAGKPATVNTQSIANGQNAQPYGGVWNNSSEMINEVSLHGSGADFSADTTAFLEGWVSS